MKYHERLRSLNYIGGKQAYSRKDWIAGLLPWAKKSCYVEPFGGMMSVLLYRAPVKMEIFNDANGDIVNWWRCVQECRDEFVQMIEASPRSRAEFEKAGRILFDEEWTLTDEPNLRRGFAVYQWIQNCQHKTFNPSEKRGSYSLRFHPAVGSLGRWKHERVEALARRLQNVQLERTDGVALLERCTDKKYVTAYVDPPYPTNWKKGGGYGYTVDYDALSDVLQRMTGQVAISGYGDEWNHLGWHRYEKIDGMPDIKCGKATPRVEVLWTNYDASVHGSAYAESMAIAERWRMKAEQKKQRLGKINADSS